MEVLSAAAISLLVLAVAVGVAIAQVRHWRRVEQEPLESNELDYRRSQFRRRIQITAMFGLATAALPFILPMFGLSPRAGTAFLGVLILLYLWGLLLAFADILAIKVYFGRLRHENRVQQLRLEAEMRRAKKARRAGRNGEAGEGDGQGGLSPGPSGHLGE